MSIFQHKTNQNRSLKNAAKIKEPANAVLKGIEQAREQNALSAVKLDRLERLITQSKENSEHAYQNLNNPEAERPHDVLSTIKEEYSWIGVLEGSPTYKGKEHMRSFKSILDSLRLIASNNVELAGGSKQLEGLDQYLNTYSLQFIEGCIELGQEGSKGNKDLALALGLSRMLDTLSIHDLGKAAKVIEAVEFVGGPSDHDRSLEFLIENNFKPLEGYLTESEIETFREICSDPVTRNFILKPSGLSKFNAGRYSRGEGPVNLFVDTSNGATISDIAENIVDFFAVNGGDAPEGPVHLAHVLKAHEGRAHSFTEIITGIKESKDRAEVWKEAAYPEKILKRMKLSWRNDFERAVTRFSFMDSNNQLDDTKEARLEVLATRRAFSMLPNDLREQLVHELNSPDLDLGFVPHLLDKIRDDVQESRKEFYEDPSVNNVIKSETRLNDNIHRKVTVMLALHREIENIRKITAPEQKRLHNEGQPALRSITANLDSSHANGISLAEHYDRDKSPINIIQNIDVDVELDSKGDCKVAFTPLPPQGPTVSILDPIQLSELPGEVYLMDGYGGGGDVVTAGCAAGEMLKNAGKKVAACSSTRKGKLEDVVKQLGRIKIISKEHNIIRIYKNTTGVIGTTGRLPERGLARAIRKPVYLILDDDNGETLHLKKQFLAEYIKADSIAAIDTGCDSYQTKANAKKDGVLDTPQQDLEGVDALYQVQGVNVVTLTCGAGIDQGAEYHLLMAKAKAKIYWPNEQDAARAERKYAKTGVGVDDSVFSRTTLVVRDALQLSADDAGTKWRFVEGVPLKHRINVVNPFMSWVKYGREAAGVVVSSIDQHHKAINGDL